MLRPAETDVPGYSTQARSASFTAGGLRVTLHPLAPDEPSGSALIDGLAAAGFVVIAMEISNSTNAKVVYNPIYTVMRDDELGYEKPLDLTDFHAMAREMDEGGRLLSEIEGRIYDLVEVIGPDRAVRRHLVFRPPDPEARRAEITMDQVYVGATVTRLRFSFELLAAGRRP